MEHQLKGKTDISKWLYINQDKSIKIKKYISEIAIFKLWIAGLSWLSRKKICQIYSSNPLGEKTSFAEMYSVGRIRVSTVMEFLLLQLATSRPLPINDL